MELSLHRDFTHRGLVVGIVLLEGLLMSSDYIGLFLGAIAIAFFTWQGLNLVSKPEEWLIKHGRSTAEKHIRATRFVGGMFLAGVAVILLQLVRSLSSK